MKNQKELETLMVAVYCLNIAKRQSRDENINKILEYAFRKCCKTSTNLLLLATIGKNEEEIKKEIEELLKQETNYFKEV